MHFVSILSLVMLIFKNLKDHYFQMFSTPAPLVIAPPHQNPKLSIILNLASSPYDHD